MNLKEIAADFLLLASSGRAAEAFRKYVGKGFIHHNPYFKGDAESLRAAMDENAKVNPSKLFQIQRVIQEGDFVVVHSRVHMTSAPNGLAVVHIFRFAANMIAELWDIGQSVPDSSQNQYGMF